MWEEKQHRKDKEKVDVIIIRKSGRLIGLHWTLNKQKKYFERKIIALEVLKEKWSETIELYWEELLPSLRIFINPVLSITQLMDQRHLIA